MAAKAAFYLIKTNKELGESTAKPKEKENELFAQAKADFANAHMSYLRLHISLNSVETYPLRDKRIKEHLLDLLRIHAIDELRQNQGYLYDMGYFGKGTRTRLDQAFDR